MENKLEDLLRKSYGRMYKGMLKGKYLEEIISQRLKIESYEEPYKKFKRILTIFNSFKEKMRVLDMACGSGGFVLFAQTDGVECYGADINQEVIEIAKIYAETLNLKDNFYIAPAEKLPFADIFFDAVISNQTMEHVQNLKKSLTECIRVLNHGGVFFLTCPDYGSFYEGHYKILWLPFFPRKIAKMYLSILGRNPDYLDSINYITKREIIKILKKENVFIIDWKKMDRFLKLDHSSNTVNPIKKFISNIMLFLRLKKVLEFAIRYLFVEIFREDVELIILKKPVNIPQKTAIRNSMVR